MADCKLAVFTQDERCYLPRAVGALIEEFGDKVECVVLSPPMSTHGGVWTGLKKHLPVFGLLGTVRMALQVAWCRLGEFLHIPAGQGRRYWSISQAAKAHGVPVYRVPRVNSELMYSVLERHAANLLVSVSCPQVVKADLLGRFEHGGINVHSAPLPLYRGLMPAFWILLNQEEETAVTVHDLAERLDNGDILHQESIPIERGETWNSLVTKTKAAAGMALIKVIRQIDEGRVERRPNRDEESTYYSFPTAADARRFRSLGKRMF